MAKKTPAPVPTENEWTQPHECNRCGCKEHGPPLNETVQAHSDIDPATGRIYTHIIRRRVQCKECDQIRIVRVLRYDPPPAPARPKASRKPKAKVATK